MPWVAIAVLGVVLIGAGVLLVFVGNRAASGRLPRNWIVGIRTTKTLDSDAAWQAAHYAAAGSFSVAGYVAVMGGLALFTRPSNIVGLVVVVVVLLVMLAAALIGAYRGFSAIDDL